MQYREIVAVTGLGGLFHLLATKSDGAIVRSLADNATRFIPSRLHNVTPLESIEIYTSGNNVRLHEVLQKMKDSDTKMPNPKKGSESEIRSYFKDIFPEMDEERVYSSDMKKMIKWFDILKGADLLDFSGMNQAPAPGNEASETEESSTAMPIEGEAQLSEHSKPHTEDVPLVEEAGEKAAKKPRAKKAVADEDAEESEKPAKKTAAKKKAASDEKGEEAPKKVAKPKKKSEE